MTASRPDPLVALAIAAALTACRAGLPPEPPGADPAEASAAATPYQTPPNPYHTSAFTSDADHKTGPDHGSMDHSGMDHGSMDHATMDHGDKDTPAAPHEHAEPPR